MAKKVTTKKVKKTRGKRATAKAAKAKGPASASHFMAQKTPSFSQAEVDQQWFLIDLNNQVLGRAASVISQVLRGKNKPVFTPHADTGDFVVAINAGKVRLTGRKWQQKTYVHYTGRPGGLRSITAEKLLATKPEELVERAVGGMLPKNSLGRHLLRKLKIYTGSEHPHVAQSPKPLTVS